MKNLPYLCSRFYEPSAALAELVDAPDLGSGEEIRVGSSPICRTFHSLNIIVHNHRFLILISVFVALLTASCKDKVEQHFTPQIRLSYFTHPAGDTLALHIDTLRGCYVTDTMAVGDTVKFAFAGMTLANNLQAVQLNWDSTALALSVDLSSEVKNVLLENSDTLKAQLFFPEGYNYIAFPVTFITKKESESMLNFTLSSDSKYSPANLQIQCIVK